MPYSAEHKIKTRARIVECARQLFNRRGFAEVSIDQIMAAAGLTRGGFYNHFKTKEDLYAETLEAFACRKKAEFEDGEARKAADCGPDLAWHMVTSYVSQQHLADVEGHCPLIALPSDVARAGPKVRAAYRNLLDSMARILEASARPGSPLTQRQQGLAVASTCVGAMVLARTIDDQKLAKEICDAVRAFALEVTGGTSGERAGSNPMPTRRAARCSD